jgi:hypothetical protein
MREYTIKALGPDGQVSGEIRLECDSDLQAVTLLFGVESPCGHVLLQGARFLGRFRGAAMVPHEESAGPGRSSGHRTEAKS